MEQKAKHRQRFSADGVNQDDLSRYISSEFIPTVKDLQAAELDERFGVVIPQDAPKLWWSLALCMPPANQGDQIYWGCGFLGRSSSGYGDGSFEDAVCATFDKVDYYATKNVALGVKVPVPLKSKLDPNLRAVVVLPVAGSRWSAFTLTRMDGWQPFAEGTTRALALKEADEFTEFAGFDGWIIVYPPPVAQP